MKRKTFLDAKEKALKSLEKACNEKKADMDILPLLSLINKSEDCYTSSSCSGRIVILEIPQIGDKKKARFLGIWHKKIELKEVETAVSSANNGYLWFIAQSPIIHIITDKIEVADKILKTAIGSGFKNSGLKSLGKKIVVEVCSTERLDTPIGKDGLLYYNYIYLQILVDISNEILQKSTDKIARFENKLEEIIG